MKSGISAFLRNPDILFALFLRNADKELQNADKTFCNSLYLCIHKARIMDITVIITIIISTIVALAIVALVVMLFYYHWRNQELLINFSAFIRENLKLKDEIDKLQEENKKLLEQRPLRETIYNKVSA